MRRRDFIRLLGGTASWPLAAHAQPAERMRRIGMLFQATKSDLEFEPRLKALLDGLAQFGWTEGRNLQLEYRWAGGNVDEIRRHAAELVVLAPDVLVAAGSAAVGALQQATRTIPIVFAMAGDPVGAGFVESLARPGGNITGFATFEYAIGAKWLALLKDVSPRTNRVAVLRDPACGWARATRRDTNRGAFCWYGGHSDQRARAGRDRACRYSVRAIFERRSDCHGKLVGTTAPRLDHLARGPAQTTRGLLRTVQSKVWSVRLLNNPQCPNA
jgi:hypothetical protein